MKRIDPATFPEKFKKHGVRPSRAEYIGFPQCRACAIGIEVIDIYGLNLARQLYGPTGLVELYDLTGLTRDYALGLDHGWQGVSVPRPGGANSSDDYNQGHEDGKAAWEACQAQMTAW